MSIVGRNMIKKAALLILCIAVMVGTFSCGEAKETVVIYSSAEDYSIEYLTQRLNEEFPEYNIIIEYLSTGNHAAKLLAEKTATECDVIHDLEYGFTTKKRILI